MVRQGAKRRQAKGAKRRQAEATTDKSPPYEKMSGNAYCGHFLTFSCGSFGPTVRFARNAFITADKGSTGAANTVGTALSSDCYKSF
jgi:hypothetical protein